MILSPAFKNIFMKYHITLERIKKLLGKVYDPDRREQGLVISGTTLAIVGGATVVLAIAGWFAVKNEAGQAVVQFTAGMVLYLADILLWISQFLCYTAADMFDTAVTSWLHEAITTNSAFTAAWSAVRDFSSMFIVLGFVGVGIATALRIREYEAKKLLAPLIIMAILINFTGLFCGLAIDASNILTTSLIQAGGIGGGTGMAFFTTIQKFETELLTNAHTGDAINTNLDYLGAALFIVFEYMIVAATFFYMAIIFIVRYAMLAFVYILSPLAFTCRVFPLTSTQKIWHEWWDQLVKWAWIGVGGSLALWVSSSLMLNAAPGGKISLSNMAVMLLFLVVGFRMTTKKSGAVASAITGLATGAAGFAVGAIAAGAAGGAKILGKTKAGGYVAEKAKGFSNASGRAMERIGLRETGTTATANSKQVESSASLMSKEYAAAKASNDQGSMERIRNLARTGRGARGAAAMKVITDSKDINETFKDKNGKVDLAKASGQLSYAESVGATGIRKTAEDLNPGLAAYNSSTVNKVMSGNPRITNRADAEVVAVVEANKKLGQQQRRDLHPDNITEHALTGSVDSTLKAAEQMNPAQREKYRQMYTPGTNEYNNALALSGQLARLGMTREADNILDHLTDKRMAAL